jgi:hypothetical protein
MIVTFLAVARSRAAMRSPRSISREVAGTTVLGIKPARALSTRANHQDLVTTSHWTGGEAGSVVKAHPIKEAS